MVALLSNLIQSFRYILSSIAPSVPLLATFHNHSVVHPLNIPLPQVMHKVLSKEFVDKFDEVIVIGDIHGCYDEMIRLLSQINAISKESDENNDSNNNLQNNTTQILKLFVGDLVNKGPKSKEVIQFMINNSDSCLSVRGNHDEVVIKQYLEFISYGEEALKEKNLWMKELTQKQVDYLISMPYTISIPTLNALIVHAGIVPNVELHKQNIKDMVEMRNIVDVKSKYSTDKQLVATSSHMDGKPWVKKWLGPQHIYFGHDAKRKLQKTEFSTGLDTGCVYGNALTGVFIKGPRKGSFASVKAHSVHSPPKSRD